jgi:hypothetical protein
MVEESMGLDESRRIWSELEMLLSQVLDDIDGAIGMRDTKLLREFIESREYGVARDWLRSVLSERNIAISNSSEQKLRQAESLMGIVA